MTIFVSWGGSEREVHKERADQTAPPNATLTEPGDRCRTRQGRDSPGGTGQDRQQHLHTYIHTYSRYCSTHGTTPLPAAARHNKEGENGVNRQSRLTQQLCMNQRRYSCERTDWEEGGSVRLRRGRRDVSAR